MDADQPAGSVSVAASRGHAPMLEYGPARRRRRWPWLLLVTAVVLVTAGFRYHRPVRAKWAQLAFERKCLNYRQPADLVVYTDDPSLIKGLVNASPQPVGGTYREFYSEYVNFYPDVWVRHPLLKWDPGPAFLHRR